MKLRDGITRIEIPFNNPEISAEKAYGEIKQARQLLTTTRLHVIIRPRGGNFVYSPMEIDRMLTDIRIARELGADGVHLGKNDMPIREARQLLGPDFIIGGTANTFEDAKAHYEASADYIGCGPFRFTTTKKKLAPVLGLEGYRSIIHQIREARIDIPVVAIGGITKADIPAILQTGITGIALSGTVLRADDPIAEMNHIINIINHE
jgi:thiamine-phosphate diphosphorylase